jgi:hypothetical protein
MMVREGMRWCTAVGVLGLALAAWAQPVHPSPSLGLHLGGDACQLVLRQLSQQGCIVEVNARIALRKQVLANASA